MAFVDLGPEVPDPTPEDVLQLAEDGSEMPKRDVNDPGVNYEEFQSGLRTAIQSAINYAEEELAQKRKTAQEFYDGDELEGDSELDETRSKFISRDVHDTVKKMLPSLLRVFFGGRSVVAYDPVGPEDEPFAKQATDYVNDIVLQKDNAGFKIFYDVFWDTLVKGLGTVMWYWQDNYEVVGQEYAGLNEQEFMLVSQGPNVTNVQVNGQYPDPQTGQMLIDCHVTYRIVDGGKVIIDAVPPEERLINKTARTIDGSFFYGRRRVMTVSEIVAMGYDYNQVVGMGGSENLDTNEEAVMRQDNEIRDNEANSPDPSMREIEYVDGYFRVDLDGDGYAELYHVACGGNAHEVLLYANGQEAIEMVDDIPYAEFCPDPIPHLATGESIANQVMDIQRSKSNLIRAAFDSLSRSIFPQTEFVQGQVNIDDLLNPEIGGLVRTKAPGMIREITTQFMGREAMPILGYMDDVKKSRTGINDATQGLDPAALQSTTAIGVNAAVAASQEQIEMVARLLAQIGMTRVFKGILKLIKTHQDKIRVIRLKNEWVPVDPTPWNAQMDATVNVALGRGTDQEKLAALMQIAEKQEMVMQQLGPTNMLTTPVEYRHTLSLMTELAGYPNADQFFLPVQMQQVVQQEMDQKTELQEQLEQAQQVIQQLNYELEHHTQADSRAKDAKAMKDTASAVGEVVDAAVAASQQTVEPNAAQDEARAIHPLLQ